MVLGDGVSTTNSKRWSTYWALMKLSVLTVVTITSSRRLREKHQNMHNLWFINRHTNLHKSAYVHIHGTHIGVELFGHCHFTLFGKCWALAGSSALCLCVFMCLLTYYNTPPPPTTALRMYYWALTQGLALWLTKNTMRSCQDTKHVCFS